MSTKRNQELSKAVRSQDAVRVVKALENGASPDIRDDDGTPLMCAAVAGMSEIVHLLVAAGASVNVKDKDGDTPLLRVLHTKAHDLSAEERITVVVDKLLGAGAKTGIVGSGGWTATQKAAYFGHAKALRLLLAAGSDPNEVPESTHRRETAVQYAARSGVAECLKVVLEAGGDPNGPISPRRPPLLDAVVSSSSANLVQMLVLAGADVNGTSSLGETALMFAALAGNVASIEALLRAGANVNATCSKGKTALMYAVEPPQIYCDENVDPSRILLIVDLLCTSGASISAKDANGNSPVMLALQHAQIDAKYLGIVELLEERRSNEAAL